MHFFFFKKNVIDAFVLLFFVSFATHNVLEKKKPEGDDDENEEIKADKKRWKQQKNHMQNGIRFNMNWILSFYFIFVISTFKKQKKKKLKRFGLFYFYLFYLLHCIQAINGLRKNFQKQKEKKNRKDSNVFKNQSMCECVVFWMTLSMFHIVFIETKVISLILLFSFIYLFNKNSPDFIVTLRK